MSQAWPAWRGTLRKRSGGWNNTTYFVESGERRAVLRIYDTHKDRNKIEFEHVVLQKLQALNLPFSTPAPILTAAGETIAQLGDGSGKFACLFAYIDGESPQRRHPLTMNPSGKRQGHCLLRWLRLSRVYLRSTVLIMSCGPRIRCVPRKRSIIFYKTHRSLLQERRRSCEL